MEKGNDLERALKTDPDMARCFGAVTFDLVQRGSLPTMAAAFGRGRGDVTPAMFTPLLADLPVRIEGRLQRLIDYQDRHVNWTEFATA